MRRALVCLLAACGPASGDPADGGTDVVYGRKPIDAGTPDVSDEPAPKMPSNRMSPHGDVVLSAPRVATLYVAAWDAGGSESFDAYLTWLLATPDYWGAIMPQYGVGYGSFAGSVTIDAAAFFIPGMLTNDVVAASDLAARVEQVIHASGGDAGGADAGIPPVPAADGYVVFLPSKIIVDLGFGGQTCVGVGGYHDYDGVEPFAVIPDCGRGRIVVSHEVAEMCTDPQPGLGWFSDKDLATGGGEIGDLCNFSVTVDGDSATALWSNKDGDCEP